MKIFERIESNSYKVSRVYWNVFVILSLLTLLGSLAVFMWSLLPAIEKNVDKQEYPAHVQVNKQEIERKLNPYDEEELKPELDESDESQLVTETIVTSDEPKDTLNKPDYDLALNRLRRYLGDTFWSENSMSNMVINFSSIDLEDGYDNLFLYIGPNTEAENSFRITEGMVGRDIVSSHATGALTVVFQSDLSGTNGGWEATLRSVGMENIPSNQFQMRRNRRIQTDGGYFYDSGGPNRDYQNGESYQWSFFPMSVSSTPSFLEAYFKRSEIDTYKNRTEWLNNLANQIDGFNWDGYNLGNMVKSMIDFIPNPIMSDEESMTNWIRLHKLINSEKIDFNSLAVLYNELSISEKNAVYSYVSKTPNEKDLIIEKMITAYLDYPFYRDFEAFQFQNENFYRVMENYGGGYAAVYQAMLEVYADKSVQRNILIDEIEEEYERLRNEAQLEAMITQGKKEAVKLTSVIVVGSSLSAIALLALFLVLLSIHRVISRIEGSIIEKKL